MADGTFAAVMFILGAVDMMDNHCGTDAGCLGKSPVTPRFAASIGGVIPRRADKAAEIYLRYDLGHKIGPFGNALGLSVMETGETWIGFGQTYTLQTDDNPLYIELHAMTGLYANNGGYDLGGVIEFRSGFDLGYEAENGIRYSFGYDHRSNTGIYKQNPGIETYMLRISIPFQK